MFFYGWYELCNLVGHEGAIMTKNLILVLVLLGCSTAKAVDPAVGKNLVTYLPQKHHSTKSTKVIHGKPLFKYPKENLVYIVTYTRDDLQKMKRDKMMRDLENPGNTGSDDFIK